MKTTPRWRRAATLATLAAAASCSSGAPEPISVAVQPGAPGEASRRVEAEEIGSAPTRAPHSEADLRFIHGMIAHHRQAVEMTRLAPTRTTREDVLLLARRIDIGQADEIRQMERWLRARAAEVPGPGAHHGHGAAAPAHPAMHGMLTPEELERLAASSGPEFDRLFLELMIRHHEGALVMVEELFARRGGGQEGEIYQLAAEVAGDQRIEIDRMRRMLAGRQPGE